VHKIFPERVPANYSYRPGPVNVNYFDAGGPSLVRGPLLAWNATGREGGSPFTSRKEVRHARRLCSRRDAFPSR
jgi:hypothetical protein